LKRFSGRKLHQKRRFLQVVRHRFWLLLFFEFDDHDFHGLVAGVDVGVEGVGGHGGEPVGFAGLPVMWLDGASGIDDIHGAAGEGDDDTGMIVVVHGEGLVGEDDRFPDFDVFVFELRDSLGLGGFVFDLRDDGRGAEYSDDEGCGLDQGLHEDSFWRECSTPSPVKKCAKSSKEIL
jgi:hypothetical protein